MKKNSKITRRRFVGATSVAATGMILLPWGCSGSGQGFGSYCSKGSFCIK